MRRYLIKTIVFLFPVLVCVVICEAMLRRVDNDYKYKNNWLSKNASSVQVLSLGSSHGYFGIDPTQFELNAFNAAHVSQDIKYDNFIFNKFVNEMDSLKFIILPISYFTPCSNLEKGIEDWRVKYYMMYYHCPYHPLNLKFHLEIADGIHPLRVLRAIQGKDDNRYCTDLGQGTQYKLASRSDNWKESGKVAAERHTGKGINWEQYQQNMPKLKEILETCKSKGIKVILLTTPTYYTYRENLLDEKLNLAFDCCREMQKKYDNTVWLNLLDDDRFVDDDFYDADHLNEYGAKKLSAILNDYILCDIEQ